jgi:uncharacterized membrane protein YsdA (DUF1294 family)/cold shock CspA family protein
MRIKGKIAQWDDDKGFGFIQPALGGERVFVHVKALQNRQRRPQSGEVVTYSLGKDERGRTQASSVTYAGEKLRLKKAKESSAWPLTIVLVFFGLLVLAYWQTALHPYVLYFYAGISIITFLGYALDKHKARTQQWRTQESTLHLLALLGGWPGALLAQNYLRHKSSKRSFRYVFWAMVWLNIVALVWLSSQVFVF